MFVCIACGYLWKEADSPPEECPACTAPKEKYIPYDEPSRAVGQTRRLLHTSCTLMKKRRPPRRELCTLITHQICPRRITRGP